MNEEDRAYLSFSCCMGIGPRVFDRLLKTFGSAHTAYHATEAALTQSIGAKYARILGGFRKTFGSAYEWDRICAQNIRIIPRTHALYPSQFFHLADPPICLYVKGEVEKYNFSQQWFFAIVGTRNPTSYGMQVTQKFSRELTEIGCIIVSGMAMGIDTIAHRTCLEASGKTIAFLGCGVNIIYPQVNTRLYHSIVDSGGLVVSEFPPDMTTQKGLFVSRNRLIAALSMGVLVAEGLKDSGSLVTARCALEVGKEVFAPPAPINSVQSEAPNMLLKQGAKLVTCKEDILEEFSFFISKEKKQSDRPIVLGIEKDIYEMLMQEALSIDEISKRLHKPTYEVMSAVSGLELTGFVVKDLHGIVHIQI